MESDDFGELSRSAVAPIDLPLDQFDGAKSSSRSVIVPMRPLNKIKTTPPRVASEELQRELRSLLHSDHDCVAAQTQHQPLALGPQTQNDAMFVLQPQVPRARRAQGKAIAALRVRTRKVA